MKCTTNIVRIGCGQYAGTLNNGNGFVMAAEWMQPKGCEQYGSDNSIFYTVVENV